MKAEVIQTRTLRELVNFLNTENINKENIVTVMQGNEGYSALYYR